jgi:hypothetical protein
MAKATMPDLDAFKPKHLWDEDVELTDEDWFKRRWEGGEQDASWTAATTLVTRLDAEVFGHESVELGVSNAVGPLGAAWRQPWVSIVPSDCPPALATLSLLAAHLTSVMPLAGMPPYDAYVLRIHVAATAWIQREEVNASLDEHLAALVPRLCAPIGQTDTYTARFERWATQLDQPPGEITRIHDGLIARRSDRLHRAWTRRFFVPTGLDLTAWGQSLGWPEHTS